MGMLAGGAGAKGTGALDSGPYGYDSQQRWVEPILDITAL